MQGEIPREVKDIIRNVQQMDLPENGIADIRIKIQGGDVMDRPMFNGGGGANKFPDLSGDGKVTQKDILIGRADMGIWLPRSALIRLSLIHI